MGRALHPTPGTRCGTHARTHTNTIHTGGGRVFRQAKFLGRGFRFSDLEPKFRFHVLLPVLAANTFLLTGSTGAHVLHVGISLCASAYPKSLFLCICVSAVYPKDRGSRNCTQGTIIRGCRNFPHPKMPPCVTFRLVVVSLQGPGQSTILPFAGCFGSLRSDGCCGRCSCWCRFRVRGAQ